MSEATELQGISATEKQYRMTVREKTYIEGLLPYYGGETLFGLYKRLDALEVEMCQLKATLAFIKVDKRAVNAITLAEQARGMAWAEREITTLRRVHTADINFRIAYRAVLEMAAIPETERDNQWQHYFDSSVTTYFRGAKALLGMSYTKDDLVDIKVQEDKAFAWTQGQPVEVA